jgi:HAD superfamily hydrolase (TIGR01509 family)
MKIKGIIFDFDGLICDTETPEVKAWEKLFSDFGLIFPFDRYQQTIGAVHNDESPFLFLEEMVGHSVERNKEREKYLEYRTALIEKEAARPGIEEYLQESKVLNLKIGLASSSPRSWIDHHLNRLNLQDYFDCIKTFNDVTATKPDPELFLSTIECMDLNKDEIFALEDSENGVIAAKAAGIKVVVYPNPVTEIYQFKNADLVVSSLESLTLGQLIKILTKS